MRLLAVCHYGIEVVATPVDEGLDMRQQGSAEVRDGIFRAGRDIREQFATDYAIGGQLAENLRKHLFRHRRDAAVQLVEAHRSVLGNLHENNQRPLVAQPFEHWSRLAIFVVKFFSHNRGCKKTDYEQYKLFGKGQTLG